MLERMFNYENPVWQFMNRVADLLILNLMFMIFCIPVVTFGASYTALTYVSVKIIRKEETYVWLEFWNSFKRNFKQATGMWLILIPFIAFLSLDVIMWFSNPEGLQKILKVTTVMVIIIIFSVGLYAFPILSHFDNTVRNTLKNAFLVSIINIPYTIYFIIVLLLPIVIIGFVPQMLMAYIMIGFSGTSMLMSLGWSRIFKKLEPPKAEDDVEEDGMDDDELSDVVSDEGEITKITKVESSESESEVIE